MHAIHRKVLNRKRGNQMNRIKATALKKGQLLIRGIGGKGYRQMSAVLSLIGY
jgi:hypothetical protein